MRKIKNPYLKREGYNCFGCCPGNPFGLHMEFFEEGDEIISFWRPQDYYQGWVGVMHGGILATLIDEICGWVVTRKLQTAGMTSKLELKYSKSLSTAHNQLTLRAKIVSIRGSWVTIEATIENANGEKCVEGTAIYYAFDKEKAKEMGFEHCDVEDEQLLPM